MTVALQLSHDEPRLVYLALVYHLGRPGSELDAATAAPAAHGLREVKVRLGNELDAPAPIIELDAWQYARLLSAIKGCVTELRVYHMREGAESTVERWTSTAETLFPPMREEPEAALEVAESMMMLARRIERAVSAAGRAEGPSEWRAERDAGIDGQAGERKRGGLFRRRRD